MMASLSRGLRSAIAPSRQKRGRGPRAPRAIVLRTLRAFRRYAVRLVHVRAP